MLAPYTDLYTHMPMASCWNTEGIRHRPRQNVVLTNLGLMLFRIVVKVMMRGYGRKSQDGGRLGASLGRLCDCESVREGGLKSSLRRTFSLLYLKKIDALYSKKIQPKVPPLAD